MSDRFKRERYVVVAPQGLGDTLEATPLLTALRQARPAAHVTAIVLRPQARELLAGLPQLVDAIVYLPFWERGPVAFMAQALRRLPFLPRMDGAFLTYPAARPIYLALLAAVRAKVRIAHRYDDALVRQLGALAIRQISVASKHNVERNLDLLRSAGMRIEKPDRYTIPASWRVSERHLRRRIVLHVGSIAHDGLAARRWPESNFAELGRKLGELGFEIALIAGPAEEVETARVASAIPDATVFSGPLPAVARFLSRCSFVVANDNGVAHLAAACNTPVLALFGPTPVNFGPYGPMAYSLRSSQCPPCFDVVHTDATCKLAIDYACLKRDLKVDDVLARVLELWESSVDDRDKTHESVPRNSRGTDTRPIIPPKMSGEMTRWS